MQKLKLELRADVIKKFTDLHINMHIPFEITLTNYTTKIQSVLFDLHFMKNAQSNRVFVSYAKLKKDVSGKPVEEINTGYLKYYQTNFNFYEIYSDKIYNVDIKSAYATILFNDGYISEDTFTYIKSLPKIERLAAVGMLAGRKNIFSFDANGKITGCVETISPTSNYFFYAVKRTYEIIDRLRMEIGNNFLFSWVDGIYFVGEENGIKLQELLLSEFNLNSSFDELTEFEIKKKKDCYLLSYVKDEEKKVFNIPTNESSIKRDIYNFLLTKKYNNEQENCSPKIW